MVVSDINFKLVIILQFMIFYQKVQLEIGELDVL